VQDCNTSLLQGETIMPDTDKRPWRAGLLATLAFLIVLAAGVLMLQMLHVLAIELGPVQFFRLDWLGAILWGIAGLAWLWVARQAWSPKPQGWLYTVTLAILTLFLAVSSVLGGSAIGATLPSLLLGGLVLFYCLVPGTKAAFGVPL
jgi:hypothetical protein